MLTVAIAALCDNSKMKWWSRMYRNMCIYWSKGSRVFEWCLCNRVTKMNDLESPWTTWPPTRAIFAVVSSCFRSAIWRIEASVLFPAQWLQHSTSVICWSLLGVWWPEFRWCSFSPPPLYSSAYTYVLYALMLVETTCN